MAYLFSWSL